MGSSCSRNISPRQKEADRVNEQIEKELREERKRKQDDQKLLLLGAGECGKSTILKQLNILHNHGYTKAELQNAAGTVYRNIVQGMATLLKATNDFHYEFNSYELDQDVQHILALANSDRNTMPFGPSTKKALTRLWKHSIVQETFERRAEFQMMDTLVYFMQDLERINDSDYCPSVDDMLRTRVPTTGIIENVIEMKGATFRIYDVGGQRSERKKWINCFDNVNATIFISAINEFDQNLAEDGASNRLRESMRLFDSVCNSPWFEKASMILFFNKRDLFEEKLNTTSIDVYFEDYRGSNDYKECVSYIQMQFELLNKNPDTKKIYTHVTCATDTNQIQLVIDSVVTMIIERNLRRAGMQ